MAVEDRELEAAGGQSNDALATKRSKDPLEDIQAKRRYTNEKGDSLATRFWKRRLLFAGAGIGISLIAALIALIFALLPLKLEHLMKSFEAKFGTATEHAIEKRVERATMYYLIRRAQGKNFTGCSAVEGGKVCDPIINGNSIWKDTFKNWQASKFEDRLAAEQGIRFYTFVNQNGVKRVGVHTKYGGGDFNFDEADFDADKDVFKDHKQARVAITDAVKAQTKWNQVYKRRFYRDLLREKYGVKKWRVFESQRDAVNDKVTAARTRLYNYAIENVLRPHVSESLADDIKCILEGCKNGDLNTDNPPQDIEEHNAAQAAERARIQNACEADGRPASECTRVADGSEDPKNDPLKNNAERNKGRSEIRKLTNATIRLTVQAVAGESVAKEVQKLIEKQLFEQITGKLAAGIGTMELISTIHHALDSDTIGQIIEARKKSQYVATFAMYRTMADEFKDGKMTSAEVAAMNKQLDGAENSRLYSFDFNLPRYDAKGKVIKEARAATKEPDCSDGHNLTEQEVLCPNKKVAHTTGSANWYKSSPIRAVIAPAVAAYETAVGPLVHFVLGALGDVFGPLMSVVGDLFSGVTDLISKLLVQALPVVSTGLEDGAPLYESIRIGSDVSAADVGHFTIGGKKLSEQDQIAIQTEVEGEQAVSESQKSLVARMTNLDNTNSFGSRIMAALPFTRERAVSQMATILINPLRTMASLNPLALAHAANIGDPAAVPKYGYTVDDETLNRSPADPFYNNCDQTEKEWAQKTKDNPDGDNGTNPCRLEFVAAQSANATSTTEDDGGIGTGATNEVNAACQGNSTGKVYVLGDSIMVLDYYDGQGGSTPGGPLANAFKDKNIDAYVDASGGRGMEYGGGDTANNRPAARKSGMEAIDIDKDKIKDAQTIVIELGTNTLGRGTQGQFKDQMIQMIKKIRGINGSAHIYWVGVFATAYPEHGPYNDVIKQVTSDSSIDGNMSMIETRGKVSLVGSSDDIHPAATGLRQLAKLITDGISGNQNLDICDGPDTANIDLGKLYQDSTSINCASGTKDIGVYDGYADKKKVRIRLCAVSNMPSSGQESNGGFGVKGANGKAVVNSRVSGAWYALAKAAIKDGMDVNAGSSFRTMSHQQQLWVENGMNRDFVAEPGTSNHQMGLAIDFSMGGVGGSADNCDGGRGSDPCTRKDSELWQWLVKNAEKFGMKQYSKEFWHWSPTGS